ncbi:beta-glucosidase [Microdochium nivale]|nr:beta-glucosidase [Microdochium nivale]
MLFLSAVATMLPAGAWAAFSYSAVNVQRTATPLASPLRGGTYAPAWTEASTLLPAGATYTTYSYVATPTVMSNDGKYGQSAYNALWASANFTWPSTMPFSTTVSPTPVASAELIYPPPLPVVDQLPADFKLPADFIWGVSSSAWQVEGALQAEGRGPAAMTDKLGSLPNLDGTDDGVTNTMNYYLYKQDIARLAALGVPTYSFSISWSRILPFGVAGSPVNQAGVDHYNDLINTCIEYGITPVVTLWHFDFPSPVDPNDESVIEHFNYYAKVVMTHFADRVPIWFTFNEPNYGFVYLFRNYNTVIWLARAHADVYRWYKDVLCGKGRVSLKFANNLAYPLHGPDNATDVAAAIRYQEIIFGIMANPIFLGKQVPQAALDTAGMNLVKLSDAQIAHMNGTVDFFAIDPYTAQFASPLSVNGRSLTDDCIKNGNSTSYPGIFPFCTAMTFKRDDGWSIGAPSNGSVYIAPQYVRQQLKYIWDTYRPAGGIMITEFGLPALNEGLKTLDQMRIDIERATYYQAFLRETVAAIHQDGVKVIGAIAWTAVDNNEWGHFSAQYGFQTLNRTSFERTYKRSMFDFIDFFHSNIDQSLSY